MMKASAPPSLEPHQARAPQALAALPAAALAGVMTDIDDTLTRDGAIEPAALAALQAEPVAAAPAPSKDAFEDPKQAALERPMSKREFLGSVFRRG